MVAVLAASALRLLLLLLHVVHEQVTTMLASMAASQAAKTQKKVRSRNPDSATAVELNHSVTGKSHGRMASQRAVRTRSHGLRRFASPPRLSLALGLQAMT